MPCAPNRLTEAVRVDVSLKVNLPIFDFGVFSETFLKNHSASPPLQEVEEREESSKVNSIV